MTGCAAEEDSIDTRVDSESPKVVENLKSIDVLNLNDSSNVKVRLELPDGWYAKEIVYDISLDFEFNAEKNRNIKKDSWFEFYNEKKKDTSWQYGHEGLSGSLEMPGYYRKEPLNTIFPNHTMMKKKVYSGMTVLGQADMYILECDLFPKELRTEKLKTYEMVYTWIPIENEELAYNLAITVPWDEDTEKYIPVAKKILKAQ